MPNEAAEIGFVAVTPEHYGLLGAWLSAPHMREWWGDPDEELGFIRDMVEGRDTTRPYLILRGGEPIGYIQVWYIGHHQNETWIKDHPWLAELPAETVGVDLSIGVAELLSKGIGSAALRAFVEGLRAEGRETIIIDPDPDNKRAVRAYMKAGFRPLPDLKGVPDDTLIMQYDPNANEIP
jgi:RimJ/RimL family protein N-acetyltransferase